MQAPLPADSLRAVLDSVFAAPAYDWVEQEHPFGWLERAWFWLVDFLARLRAADPLLFRIGLGVLIAVLLAIVAHAAWIMFRTLRHSAALDARADAMVAAERHDAAWFEREADRLAAEGHYVDALHAAFTGLALRLEELGALRYDPSRTPREFAREARLDPADRHRLQDLVSMLYRHAFGGEPTGLDEYRHWRSRAAGG